MDYIYFCISGACILNAFIRHTDAGGRRRIRGLLFLTAPRAESGERGARRMHFRSAAFPGSEEFQVPTLFFPPCQPVVVITQLLNALSQFFFLFFFSLCNETRKANTRQ